MNSENEIAKDYLGNSKPYADPESFINAPGVETYNYLAKPLGIDIDKGTAQSAAATFNLSGKWEGVQNWLKRTKDENIEYVPFTDVGAPFRVFSAGFGQVPGVKKFTFFTQPIFEAFGKAIETKKISDIPKDIILGSITHFGGKLKDYLSSSNLHEMGKKFGKDFMPFDINPLDLVNPKTIIGDAYKAVFEPERENFFSGIMDSWKKALKETNQSEEYAQAKKVYKPIVSGDKWVTIEKGFSPANTAFGTLFSYPQAKESVQAFSAGKIGSGAWSGVGAGTFLGSALLGNTLNVPFLKKKFIDDIDDILVSLSGNPTNETS